MMYGIVLTWKFQVGSPAYPQFTMASVWSLAPCVYPCVCETSCQMIPAACEYGHGEFGS